jgi:hypothetical protein
MSNRSNVEGFLVANQHSIAKRKAIELTSHSCAKQLKLEVCGSCKGYRGAAIEDGQIIAVACLCDGIDCRSCYAVRIHRPVSNYFSIRYGKILHVAYFVTQCRRCRRAHHLERD